MARSKVTRIPGLKRKPKRERGCLDDLSYEQGGGQDVPLGWSTGLMNDNCLNRLSQVCNHLIWTEKTYVAAYKF